MKSFLDVYVEFVKEKMNLLANFCKIAPIIYEAIKEALKEYNLQGEIYFLGSVINGTYTAASDIDVAILLNEIPKERKEIEGKVLDYVINKGLPDWIPIEFHFLTPHSFKILKKGGANLVKAEDYILNCK